MISRHTAGQIAVLVQGMSEWHTYLADKAKEGADPQADTDAPVVKKPKVDFSKMSGEEYMRYLDGTRSGV